MAATISQTFAEAHPTIRRPALRPAAASLRPWGSIAALGVLLALLIAMVPGMALVPSTTAAPQQLAAPSTTTATLEAAAVDPVVTIAEPTPQPGPHPEH
jgi:hypothetical protein